MSDPISIIEYFKKAYHLSDQDMVHLHDYLQVLHKYVRKPVTIRQEKSDPGSAVQMGPQSPVHQPIDFKGEYGSPKHYPTATQSNKDKRMSGNPLNI